MQKIYKITICFVVALFFVLILIETPNGEKTLVIKNGEKFSYEDSTLIYNNTIYKNVKSIKYDDNLTVVYNLVTWQMNFLFVLFCLFMFLSIGSITYSYKYSS